MKINIEVIPHVHQRYDTPGDYWVDENEVLQVRVSKMGSSLSEMAVALHELTEAQDCLLAGISIDEIDTWDNAWDDHPEKNKYAEPGDHPDAPYHVQHIRALALEKKFIVDRGIDWDEHDKLVLGLVE